MGGWEAPWHWVVLAIVVIALFGYKKLPDAARAVGRSLRIFKTEIKGMTEDDKARDAARDAEGPKAVEAAPVETNQPPAASPVAAPQQVIPPASAESNPVGSAPAGSPPGVSPGVGENATNRTASGQ